MTNKNDNKETKRPDIDTDRADRISDMRGKYCIVRTYSAGVFAGTIVYRDGKEVEMHNARRLWHWEGSASLSQLAMSGTSKPKICKFPEPVDKVILTEVIEILECTEAARKSIKSVPIWEA